MDDRDLQLQELKKEYKKIRARAGWGWKLMAWIFGVLSVLLGICTVFVLFNGTAWVQAVDNGIWEPLKATLKLGIDYAAGWRLVESYGLIALMAALVLTATFDVLGAMASNRTKMTEEYLNYRTLKLTLEAEKEER